MYRLADQPYMNQEKRDGVLSQINLGRARQARIQSTISSLPAWTDRPFKADQENFNQQMKVFQDADKLVSAVETRLRMDPGPVWKDFTPEEQTAFNNWTNSLATMEGYVNAYFPSEDQQRYMTYVCMGVAVVSFVLPLLISDGDAPLTFPLKPKPVPLPPGMKPRVAPSPAGAALPVSQRPVFRPSAVPGRESVVPTSFSRIPAPSIPQAAAAKPIPVQAEVLRPATAAAPWRQSVTAPPSAGLPTAGFRNFVRPLGPSEPVSARTAAATATGTPVTTGPTEAHSPRIYPKPQFRRQ